MHDTKDPADRPLMEEIGRHDHVCLIYEEEAEILNPVISFIQKGIALGERCLYLHAGQETLERVLKSSLVGQKHDAGALVLLPVQDAWLRGGGFDPGRLME